MGEKDAISCIVMEKPTEIKAPLKTLKASKKKADAKGAKADLVVPALAESQPTVETVAQLVETAKISEPVSKIPTSDVKAAKLETAGELAEATEPAVEEKEDDALVDVKFKCMCHTVVGLRLYVCGQGEALGDWDMEKAVDMWTGGDSYPFWRRTLRLPRGEQCEFKFLLKRTEWEDGTPCEPVQVEWESFLGNRVITPLDNHADIAAGEFIQFNTIPCKRVLPPPPPPPTFDAEDKIEVSETSCTA